jgi:hypothetical protein
VTGTLLKSSIQSGFINDRTELDPFGAVVGNSDPYFSDPDPTYFDLMGQKPLYIEGGDPFNMTSPCSIDGIPVTCDVVKNSWGTGNEEAMAVAPDGVTRRFRNGQWEYFKAFADGRQGYLPNGAVLNHEGGWYDPYSRTEGRLQVSDPNFLSNLNLIDNAPVARQVRSAASQFFVDNGKCANAISAALFKMNTANFSPSVEDRLNQLGFIDVTQNPEIAGIPAYTAFLNTSIMPGLITTGETLARVYGHTNTFRALPSETSGRTIRRPTIFVGELYHKQSPYQQRFIAGHESLHGVFKGDHEFIAKALGLSYAISADDAETNFNANRAINEWLAGGCSGFRGVTPVQ